jgi:hypothetical protein
MTTETAAQIIARKREAKKLQAEQIRTFCDLRAKVNREVFGFSVPSDCLCDRNEALPENWNWQDNGDVMAFILSAVEHAIETGYGQPEEAQ